MTEKEKDAFIVQLRGEVTMYRDAYNEVISTHSNGNDYYIKSEADETQTTAQKCKGR